MTKVQIKSEKLTPFGGIFPIMEKFDRLLGQTIDSTLGLRSRFVGYQYSEIIRSLMSVYFCGGKERQTLTLVSEGLRRFQMVSEGFQRVSIDY